MTVAAKVPPKRNPVYCAKEESSEESPRTTPVIQQKKNNKMDNAEFVEIGGNAQAEPESGRSRRHSPLAIELRQVAATVGTSPSPRPPQTAGPADDVASSVDIFVKRMPAGDDEYDELAEFMPDAGCWLGAPACRWASSVMALIGMMVGLVLATSGACILVFFVDEEPTVWPLGVTLGTVGILLTLIGVIMWISEFLCGDCLGRAHQKIKEAPLKQALKRRSRMASRASGAPIIDSRVGSRLSNATSATAISRNAKT